MQTDSVEKCLNIELRQSCLRLLIIHSIKYVVASPQTLLWSWNLNSSIYGLGMENCPDLSEPQVSILIFIIY